LGPSQLQHGIEGLKCQGACMHVYGACMTYYLHLALNSLALDTRSLITAIKTVVHPSLACSEGLV